MSASPLRTASKVPGGAATARGSALHLILPGTFCSIIAHHSTCVVLSACVGGTQVARVSVVCAVAGATSHAVASVISALAARLANKAMRASWEDGDDCVRRCRAIPLQKTQTRGARHRAERAP